MSTLTELLENEKVFNGELIVYRDQSSGPVRLRHNAESKCFINVDTPIPFLIDTSTLMLDDWQIEYPPRLITKSELATAYSAAWKYCHQHDLSPFPHLFAVFLKELDLE
jgi:hypothetical protein